MNYGPPGASGIQFDYSAYKGVQSISLATLGGAATLGAGLQSWTARTGENFESFQKRIIGDLQRANTLGQWVAVSFP